MLASSDMKPAPKLLLALALAAASSYLAISHFAQPVRANLVTNGGFETGDFTGWTLDGCPGCAQDRLVITRDAPKRAGHISISPGGVGVPDGGSTVSLLGCALLGLAALRRKLGR